MHLIVTLTPLIPIATTWAGQIVDATRCFSETQAQPVIHFCSHVIDSGTLPKESLARAHQLRASGFEARRDYGRALEDYGKAIVLAPRDTEAIIQRGKLYRIQGDYIRAIADFDRAIAIEPKHVQAWTHRGMTRFMQGRFADAVTDLETAAQWDADNAVAGLWWYLAYARTGGRDGQKVLARWSSPHHPLPWPLPLAALYLDQATPEAVIAAANHVDPDIQRRRLCEAHFFIGQFHLLHGRPDQAADSFRTALRPGEEASWERDAARVELGRMK